MFTVLDLFSGIGGFSLGLERTGGFKTVAFCEIDPFCRRVLAKHWPGVPIYEDVTTAQFTRGQADIVCGGFPCQDISTAGKRAGITGERSGLWKYMVGAIRVVRPRYAIVENVAALLGSGLDTVLGDLASIGYDAEWHCIPASAVGAPHRRDRWWAVAYPALGTGGAHSEVIPGKCESELSCQAGERRPRRLRGRGCSEDVAHAEGSGRGTRRPRGFDRVGEGLREPAPPAKIQHATYYAALGEGIRRGDAAGQWRTEPDVGRVAHGVPSRVDRLRSLGNAVVPQIPELIGRAILEAEGLAA